MSYWIESFKRVGRVKVDLYLCIKVKDLNGYLLIWSLEFDYEGSGWRGLWRVDG